MAKYPVAVLESAGRALLKEFGGVKNLAEACASRREYNQSIKDTVGKELSYDVLVYTDDRAAWLKRRKIAFKNADATFNDIFGLAGAYLINKFMMKYGYAMVDTYRGVKAPFTLKKVAPAKRKKSATKKKAAPFGL